MLLAVPNISDGRDESTIEAVRSAFAQHATVLDLHTDSDHNRSVFSLAATHPAQLGDALVAGAQVAIDRLDLNQHGGVHPYVGVVDVAPIVYVDTDARGLACALTLTTAERFATDLDQPVFLYGELAGGRTRAELRKGGPAQLKQRITSHELTPDFGPSSIHPTSGATLMAARPPLVAFNLQLEPGYDLQQAQAIAALIRDGGSEGLPGVRAIGLQLEHGDCIQISTNIEEPGRTTLADVIAAVRSHANVTRAELVGLAPAIALKNFPDDIPMPGFDPSKHVIENRLSF